VAQDFTIDDFQRQLDQVQRAGLKDQLGRLPGTAGMVADGEDPDAALDRVRRMIDAMTDAERRDPDAIDADRRTRIAADSGTRPDEVETFLTQFRQVRELMQQMGRMSLWQRLKWITGFGKLPGPDGAA
jgi:signal recognition particle subunit SRP54